MHMIACIDMESGERLWTTILDGRVEGPAAVRSRVSTQTQLRRALCPKCSSKGGARNWALRLAQRVYPLFCVCTSRYGNALVLGEMTRSAPACVQRRWPHHYRGHLWQHPLFAACSLWRGTSTHSARPARQRRRVCRYAVQHYVRPCVSFCPRCCVRVVSNERMMDWTKVVLEPRSHQRLTRIFFACCVWC